MKKVYRGWQLLKEIEEGNIKEGTKIKDNYKKYIVKGGHLRYLGTEECVDTWDLTKNNFEIIEDQEEINIQDIEQTKIKIDKSDMEYYEYKNQGQTPSGFSKNFSKDDIETRKKINELIRAIKQLDNKIKENK